MVDRTLTWIAYRDLSMGDPGDKAGIEMTLYLSDGTIVTETLVHPTEERFLMQGETLTQGPSGGARGTLMRATKQVPWRLARSHSFDITEDTRREYNLPPDLPHLH